MKEQVTESKRIRLYAVKENVRCLKCGHKGAVQFYGDYLPKMENQIGKSGFEYPCALGGIVPYKCTNCGNTGLIDINLECLTKAFETIKE